MPSQSAQRVRLECGIVLARAGNIVRDILYLMSDPLEMMRQFSRSRQTQWPHSPVWGGVQFSQAI